MTDSRSDALHRKQMSEPEYLEWLSEMLPALGDYAKEASQVLRRIAAEKRSLQPSAPASASGALPADARLVNAPYEPGKRVVGIVIDADRFRYMHEAIDWLRSMLAAAPLPAATATSERAVALKVAKHVAGLPLTYAGPDPQGVKQLHYLMVEAIKDYAASLSEKPASETAKHQWDRDGERCARCGAKDWMGGPCVPHGDRTKQEERK